MPFLRRQRRAPSAPCAGLQSRQLHADAGDAPSDGVVVPDQPAREADQDRREGHQPWPLRDLPNGRGRSLAADVRRHPVADRPAAGAARPGMRERRHQMQQATTAEVRLHTAKSARFSGLVPSPHRFAASMRAAGTIYPCPSRSETRSLAAKTPEFGECRLIRQSGLAATATVGRSQARCEHGPATAIRAAIKAYSIAVTPLVSNQPEQCPAFTIVVYLAQ